MGCMDKELEEQLMVVGTELLKPPPSVDELLTLLDKLENCLSRVEQSPSESMQSALSPAMKAVVSKDLLRHLDVDVKVAVANCINQITRITAPDAPYDDEQMKEIFQLTVAAFEKLSDTSSRSFPKRLSMLETVAKVRSFLVMLDLECDALVVEMFKHFLKTIRGNHPDNAFLSMETIMTLVLEESEEISPDLLSPLLDSVRKGNRDVLPIARKLGEKVIQNCASKLRPYMMQAVQFMGFSLDNYSKTVASVCRETSDTLKHNEANAFNEHLTDERKGLERTILQELPKADESKVLELITSDEPPKVAKELAPEASCPEEFNLAADRSPKLVMRNGTSQIRDNDSSVDSNSSMKKLVHCRNTNISKITDATGKAESDSDSVEVAKLETKPEHAKKGRGRKSKTLMTSVEACGQSRIDSEKEAKEIGSSPFVDPSPKVADPFEHGKETTQIPPPTASQNEMEVNALPSPNQILSGGSGPKRSQRGPKKKGSKNQEADPSSPLVPEQALLHDQVEGEVPPSTNAPLKKGFEGTSDSETKRWRRSGKKVLTGNNNNEKISAPKDDVSKKEAGATDELEPKLLKRSGKKVDFGNTNEDESSLKEQEGKRRRGSGNRNSERDLNGELSTKKIVSSLKSTTEALNKEESYTMETSGEKSKRKRTPGKEETSETTFNDKNLGENLVGERIKVWWPEDEVFYEGVIDSFDPIIKKHKVLYADGEEETLTLRKERWEFARGDRTANGGNLSILPSPVASSRLHRKQKAKTNSDSLTKDAKSDVAPKRGGRTSTGKFKDDASKSGNKSMDVKVGRKSKVRTPKKVGTLKYGGPGESKGETDKTGRKSKDSALKAARKSEDDSPKTSSKSKDDTLKKITKSKGETSKKGSKSDATGTARGKSASSKVQESEDTAKGTPSDSAKAPETETLSGKKRRRRVNA